MLEDTQSVVRRFQRRFVFGINALALLSLTVILFFLALTHPLNNVFLNGQMIWAGYARPDLMYVGSILLGVVGLHGIWLLWREGKLKLRGFRFAVHLLVTLTGVALSLNYLNSWYFNEAYKLVKYTPVSPGSPSQIVVIAILLLAIISTVTLPLHGIRLLYEIMLARTLLQSNLEQRKHKRIASVKIKRKRDEGQSVVEDDGEFSDWVETEMQTKRLS